MTNNILKEKIQRKSNIELLRIVSMLLIISFHYVYKSGYVFESLSINSFIVKTFYLFGELGVNLFVLITGYFMIKGQFSLKKLIRLILEVEFCHLLALIIAHNVGIITFNNPIRDNILLFFPIIKGEYWFITAYILLYIFSPFLNILLQKMEKRTYQKFLIICIIIFSIIPTFFGIFFNTTEGFLFYSRFIWLIVIYSVGAYINLYQINIFKNKRIIITSAAISFGIMLLGILIIYKFINIFGKLGTTEVAYFWPPNTIPMFILSISIFEIFLNIKIKNNKIINTLASTTLCVYILHDGMLNPYIWQNIFKTLEHLNNQFSFIYIIGATIIIFIVCVFIDLIRQLIEKHTVIKILNSKWYKNILNKSQKLISKFLELL